MRTVTVGTLKNQLSAYIRYVKNGEEVFVRDGDVLVAKIVPVAKKVPATKPNPDDNDYAAEEAYLIATGQMKPAVGELDHEEFWKLPRPTVSDEAVKEALDWVRGK